TVQPTDVPAGAPITPAVQITARDQFGNTASGFTGNVTVAIGNNAGGGTLSGTTTQAAVSGVATFGTLNIDKTGTGYTLTASSTGLAATTSTGFAVTAAAATRLVFTVQPGNTAAGSAITPAVQVTAQDNLGNTVTTFTGTVTIAIGNNVGGGSLSGTVSRAAVAGVAGFPGLSVDKAGVGYTLSATASGTGAAASTAFNITPASAAQLVFTVQPVATTAGTAITPAVQVTARDAFGNTATGFTGSVTVAIGTNPAGGALSGTLTVALAANPGGATLSGTTSIAAVAGVATYSTLRLDKVGTGYTLTATASGLTSATSTPFNIVAGTISPSLSTVSGSPGAITASTGAGASTITVTAKDASRNAIAGATVVLAATGTGNTLTQPAATTDASGVATGTTSSTV